MGLPIYALDIETDTTVDGRDPLVAPVVAVAVCSPGEERHVFVAAGPEASVLAALDAHLRSLPPGVLVTWNGSGFDLPFLKDRFDRAGVANYLRIRPSDRQGKYPPLPGHAGTYTGTWANHRHADIAYAYAEVAQQAGIAWSLKPVARLLGFDPVEVDRERIEALSSSQLCAYVLSDAEVTAALAALLDDLDPWKDPAA